MILGDSAQIPYAAEQGHYLAHQGIEVPCSANAGISRAFARRLSGAFARRGKEPERPRRHTRAPSACAAKAFRGPDCHKVAVVYA
jgi:hypothetical protein